MRCRAAGKRDTTEVIMSRVEAQKIPNIREKRKDDKQKDFFIIPF